MTPIDTPFKLPRHCRADQEFTQLDEEAAARIGSFEAAIQVADAIPGIGPRTAQKVLAEMGRI